MCRIDSPNSLFQVFLVLQTVGPTQQYDYQYSGQEQCRVSPTLCWTINTLVKSSVLLILLFYRTMDTLVKNSVLLALLLIHQSRAVCNWSYFLQDYRYTILEQCVISPSFCRTINRLAKASVSLVSAFAGILIHQSRPVYCKSYFIQDYRYNSRDQSIVRPTFCRTINALIETSVSLVLLSVGLASFLDVQSSFFIKENLICAMIKYHAEPNINILLTRNFLLTLKSDSEAII